MTREHDLGFSFRRVNDQYIISHRGRTATTLRGTKAAEFESDIADMSFNEQQLLMARLTGNYRRENERVAKSHPRNRR